MRACVCVHVCVRGDNQRQKLQAGKKVHSALISGFWEGGGGTGVGSLCVHVCACVCRDGGAEIEESLRWRVVQIVSQSV